MLTIEEVREEYFRISESLGIEALTGDNYNSSCKQGYSVFQIKKKLGLSWNGMKKIIGAKEATSVNSKGGTGRNKKIYCARGAGRMIGVKDCLVNPSSKDCQSCPDKQVNNVQASPDTLTEEEETIMRNVGCCGGSMDAALNDAIW
jgi:hypothetical protein